MCQEERFVRVKEAPGIFPVNAIQFCLSRGGITINDLAAVGWNWNPMIAAERGKQGRGPVVGSLATVAQFALRHTPLRTFSGMAPDALLPERAVGGVKRELLYWHNLNSRIPVMCFDHHLAHAASAFYPSGFERATIVTWDCWAISCQA